MSTPEDSQDTLDILDTAQDTPAAAQDVTDLIYTQIAARMPAQAGEFMDKLGKTTVLEKLKDLFLEILRMIFSKAS
jgi:hypothetical protein